MKKSKLVWALYIVAALLGVMFLYMIVSSITYISDYCASYGMSVSDMMGEAVSYVLSNSISYLIYGILIFVGARILDVLTPVKAEAAEAADAKCGAAGTAAAAGAAAAGAAAANDDAAAQAEEPAAAEEAVTEAAEGTSAMKPVPPIYTARSFRTY